MKTERLVAVKREKGVQEKMVRERENRCKYGYGCFFKLILSGQFSVSPSSIVVYDLSNMGCWYPVMQD